MRSIGHRQGVALIMVLVLIVMISLGAYAFTDLMTAQERATVMMGRRAQARAAVVSGVEYLKDYLSLPPEEQTGLGGHWDNPGYFSDVVVADETTGTTTRFAVVSVVLDQYGEPTGLRFGLEDLSSKVNVNEIVKSDRYKGNSSSPSGGGASGGNPSGEETSEEPDEDDESEGGDGPGDDGPGGGGPDGGGPDGGREEEGPEDREPDSSDNETSPSDSDDESESGDDPDAIDPLELQREVLMQLPLMSEAIADSILDWIDSDTEPRPFGAEAESYTFVEPPNGPINSLDELLLVHGVTPELLYGADRNHNGAIDASEQGAAATLSAANGSMTRGWAAYLTVLSKDVLPQAEEPVDLNQEDLEALYDELLEAGFDADFATYVIAYRQNGPYTMPEPPEDPNEEFDPPEPQEIDGRTVDLSKGGGTQISSVLDLLASYVQTTFEGEDEAVVAVSPFGPDADLGAALPDLMGALSTGDSGGTGRINLNACTGPVGYGIPDLDPTLMQTILGAQDPGGTSGDLNYLFPTWPLAQGIVTVDEMKAMLPFVSASGIIFRAQVVGYSDVPGAFARAEVVIDASDGTPRVVSWRDLTHLGPGFQTEQLSAVSVAGP